MLFLTQLLQPFNSTLLEMEKKNYCLRKEYDVGTNANPASPKLCPNLEC